MYISSISAYSNKQKNVNFNGLFFQNNADKIISKGSSAVASDIDKLVRKMKSAKGFDLYVKPEAGDSVSFYWTKQNSKEPIMIVQNSPFTKLILENSKSGTEHAINSQKAEELYNAIRKPGLNLFERLNEAVKMTLNFNK